MCLLMMTMAVLVVAKPRGQTQAWIMGWEAGGAATATRQTGDGKMMCVFACATRLLDARMEGDCWQPVFCFFFFFFLFLFSSSFFFLLLLCLGLACGSWLQYSRRTAVSLACSI